MKGDESKIKVLDHGFIELLDSMGGDLRVVNAARVSFGKRKNVFDKADEKLINFLAKHKHMSPFRHTQMCFHLKAPEFVMRQWYKHVVGITYSEGNSMHVVDHAWNEISMRYVDMKKGNFYIPEKWRKQSKSNKQASDLNAKFSQKENKDMYNELKKHVDQSLSYYNKLVESGVAKEMARIVLPLNIYTEVIWTVSLEAVVNFVKLRDHDGSQFEIRLYAKAIKKLLDQVAPVSTNALLFQ